MHFKEKYAQIKDSRHDLGFQTEIKEIPINMHDMMIETDKLLNRPPTPPYVPFKPGQDVEVQAEELFDFERQVEPLLDLIVDQVINDAYLKYYYEQEINVMTTAIQHHKDKVKLHAMELQSFELKEEEMMKNREIQSTLFLQKQQETELKRQQIVKQKQVSQILGDIIAQAQLKAWQNTYLNKEPTTSISYEITTNNLVSTCKTTDLSTQLMDMIIQDALSQINSI